MNRKLCLLFLVCLAVELVKSESTIEIDENGDEYEVKKFNIQGRQLGSGRSQCVITRRKRATQPKPMYSNDGSDDEVDDKDDGDFVRGEEQNPMLFYSPPSNNPTVDENDEEGNEEVGEESNMQMNKDKEVADEEMNNNKNDNDYKKEMNQEENEEYENDTIEVVQLPQLPIFGQLQSDEESVAAAASASGVTQTEHHNGSNGIMLVQSHTPPKVNPQTHAVFQLVSLNQAVSTQLSDDNGDDVEDDFHYNEDLSPVTTTAIWSTGDDNSNNLYDEGDYKPLRSQEVVKKTKKPAKTKNKKKKSSSKPKRRNKYKLSTKTRISGLNKKPRNKKKERTNKNRVSVRRPVKRHKLRRGNTTRRSRPSSGSNGNSNKKNSNNNYNKTVTQTGGEDGDSDVNCIYIRKDPPPTTRRPFWNIFGRSANGAPIASGHYGKRKRVNVRFVA